jgi:hypothetical protein
MAALKKLPPDFEKLQTRIKDTNEWKNSPDIVQRCADIIQDISNAQDKYLIKNRLITKLTNYVSLGLLTAILTIFVLSDSKNDKKFFSTQKGKAYENALLYIGELDKINNQSYTLIKDSRTIARYFSEHKAKEAAEISDILNASADKITATINEATSEQNNLVVKLKQTSEFKNYTHQNRKIHNSGLVEVILVGGVYLTLIRYTKKKELEINANAKAMRTASYSKYNKYKPD